MAINLNEAVKKLTKSEFALYASTELSKLKNLTEKQIKSKISQVDKLMKKAQTQKSKVKRTLKTKGMASKVAESLPSKIKFFERALKRLETQLQKMLKQAEKASKKKVSKKKVTKKKTAKKKIKQAPRKKSVTTKVKATKTKSRNPKDIKKTGVLRKQGHASSRTKRRQGRKDSR